MKFNLSNNNLIINKKDNKAIRNSWDYERYRKIKADNFKMISFFLIILSLILIFIPNILSLGITPGRVTIDLVSGADSNSIGSMEKEVEIQVLNNEHKPMKVIITSVMQDDLDGAVTLFNDVLEFIPSEEKKSLKYNVKIPNSLKPGLHKGEIVALEVPDYSSTGTSVGATLAVVSQIYVYVPCPGKCVEGDLTILDAEQNATATFIIPVINRGKLGIGEARATIDIYRGQNEKITTLETDYHPINSGERTELSAKWEVNVPKDEYRAVVTIFFDGENEKFEKTFSVGEKLLNIESILVNNFQLGEIAKLQILIENRWNQKLDNVYANLLVYDKSEQVMADIKSSTEIIDALSKKELIAYWDTVGVAEGEYSGKLMINYDQKSTDKNLVLKVSQNSLDIFGVGYAIRPSGGSDGINITTILLVLVILLLIVNLAWFVFFRRIIGSKKIDKK